MQPASACLAALAERSCLFSAFCIILWALGSYPLTTPPPKYLHATAKRNKAEASSKRTSRAMLDASSAPSDAVMALQSPSLFPLLTCTHSSLFGGCQGALIKPCAIARCKG